MSGPRFENVRRTLHVGDKLVDVVMSGRNVGYRYIEPSGKRHYCWDPDEYSQFLSWVETYIPHPPFDLESIKTRLRAVGKSMEDLCLSVGVGRSKARDWLDGLSSPSKVSLRRIKEVLDGFESDYRSRKGHGQQGDRLVLRGDVDKGVRSAVSQDPEALHRGEEAGGGEAGGVRSTPSGISGGPDGQLL